MCERKYPSSEKKRERKKDRKRSHGHFRLRSSAAGWQVKTRQSNERESIVAPDFGVAKLFSQFKRLLGREHWIPKRVNTSCKQERGSICLLEMQRLWAVPERTCQRKTGVIGNSEVRET